MSVFGKLKKLLKNSSQRPLDMSNLNLAHFEFYVSSKVRDFDFLNSFLSTSLKLYQMGVRPRSISCIRHEDLRHGGSFPVRVAAWK